MKLLKNQTTGLSMPLDEKIRTWQNSGYKEVGSKLLKPKA